MCHDFKQEQLQPPRVPRQLPDPGELLHPNRADCRHHVLPVHADHTEHPEQVPAAPIPWLNPRILAIYIYCFLDWIMNTY